MNALVIEFAEIVIAMAIIRLFLLWALTMAGYPPRSFDFKSISVTSAFFASGWCASVFHSVNITTKPPEILPLAILTVIVGVFVSALLGGYLGECLADFAIEKGRSKK